MMPKKAAAHSRPFWLSTAMISKMKLVIHNPTGKTISMDEQDVIRYVRANAFRPP